MTTSGNSRQYNRYATKDLYPHFPGSPDTATGRQQWQETLFRTSGVQHDRNSSEDLIERFSRYGIDISCDVESRVVSLQDTLIDHRRLKHFSQAGCALVQLIIQSFRDQPTIDFLELPLDTIFSALYPTRHYTLSDPAGRRAFGRLINKVSGKMSPFVVLMRISDRRRWHSLLVKIVHP